MSLPVGGRGKKAPYETVVLRIPSPLVSKVQEMISDYRDSIVDTQLNKSDSPPNNIGDRVGKDFNQALEEAKRIVKFKKSSAESLAKLLQVLYGTVVTKEDLKE